MQSSPVRDEEWISHRQEAGGCQQGHLLWHLCAKVALLSECSEGVVATSCATRPCLPQKCHTLPTALRAQQM